MRRNRNTLVLLRRRRWARLDGGEDRQAHQPDARRGGALQTGAEALAAACPFCITMFEDGIKGVEAQEKFEVEDIAEILARALEVK